MITEITTGAALEPSAILEPTTASACAGLVWPAAAPPASRNPYYVYVASLASSESRRAMKRNLDQIACLASGVGYEPDNRDTGALFPWEQLRFQHTAKIRADLTGLGWGPSTVNGCLTALRKVLEAAWNLELIGTDDYHKARNIKNVKAHRVLAGRSLSGDEVVRLCDACTQDMRTGESYLLALRDAALIVLLAAAGLREAELVSAGCADYDGAGRWLNVIGKGNKQRRVPVHPNAVQALDRWLGAAQIGTGSIFRHVNKWGHVSERPLSTEGVRYIIERRRVQAGLRPFTPHDLRRTFIGDLLDAGAHLPQAQALAGHADADTTSKYVRHDDRNLQAAVDRLNIPAIPGGEGGGE